MEPLEELSLLVDCTDQDEWAVYNNSGWKPWNESPASIIAPYYHAASFLQTIAKSYETIRVGAYDDPDFFTKNYLEQTSKEHIQIFHHLVFKKFGWPDHRTFDSECLQGVFLIAQHANHDEHFQQLALKHFAQLTSDEGRQYYAYLSDRIRINRGQPQYYGTLINIDGNFYPIQGYNPNQVSTEQAEIQLQMVNERRAIQGLPPLENSLEKLSELLQFFKTVGVCQAVLPS